MWVFYSLASAVALPGLMTAWRSWQKLTRRLWSGALIALVIAAALYPVLATPAKIRDRFQAAPLTLDGLAFAEDAQYEIEGSRFALKPDLEAIRWIQDNIQGSPVILEMNTDTRLYSWGSRFSIHTGLPSVVGWSWHQRQQQVGLTREHVTDRIEDVQTLYRTEDVPLARSLIAKYGVALVVVGELERIYGTPAGLDKFEHMDLVKLYDRLGVKIYAVPARENSHGGKVPGG